MLKKILGMTGEEPCGYFECKKRPSNLEKASLTEVEEYIEKCNYCVSKILDKKGLDFEGQAVKTRNKVWGIYSQKYFQDYSRKTVR